MRDLDPNRIPVHVGIIMDGNGRWARMRNLPRSSGHKEGLTAAKNVVRAASDLGIRFLTLYTFSTENWKRAHEEVSFLMRLIRIHLRKEWDFYRENNIRVVHSGDMTRLPRAIQKEITSVMDDTATFGGLTLNLAINYGGRDEIVRAVNKWTAAFVGGNGTEPEPLTEGALRGLLDCPAVPDADLVIRTGGEQRVSNFLLWQSAYAELVFSDRLWPEFGADELLDAVATYQLRVRKYGAVPDEAGNSK